MNREIQFRGIHVERKEWIYGGGIVIIDEDYIAIPLTKGITSEAFEMAMSKVIPETAGQFTGFNGKGLVPIFEGDTVNVIDHPTGTESHSGTVIFKDGIFTTDHCPSVPISDYGTAWVERTGTIHDHLLTPVTL